MPLWFAIWLYHPKILLLPVSILFLLQKRFLGTFQTLFFSCAFFNLQWLYICFVSFVFGSCGNFAYCFLCRSFFPNVDALKTFLHQFHSLSTFLFFSFWSRSSRPLNIRLMRRYSFDRLLLLLVF